MKLEESKKPGFNSKTASKSDNLRLNCVLLILLSSMILRAEVRVNFIDGAVREITIPAGSTPWVAAAGPYVIEANVSVAPDATLRIEPGTVVQIAPGAGLYCQGSIQATNTIFTIRGTGNWRGIYIGPGTSESVLDRCTIQYAGQDNLGYFRSGWRRVSLYLDDCNARVSGCQIADGGGHGVELFKGRITLANNTFLRLPKDWHSIVCDSLTPMPKMLGNENQSPGTLGVWVPGGEIAEDQTWNQPGKNLPYFLADDLSVKAGVTLTLDPGVQIRSQARAMWFEGHLKAAGTVAEPIYFRSARETPAPGDWRGIYFGPSSTNSLLRYVNIQHAGAQNLGYLRQGWRASTIFIDSSAPAFENLTIQQSAWNGIETYSSSVSVSHSTIESCGGRAILAQAGGHAVLTDVTIANSGTTANGYYAVWTDAQSMPAPSRVSFSANPYSAIEVGGGTVDTSIMWRKWADNAPYVLTGDVSVAPKVDWVIEPGSVLKANQCGIYVNGTVKILPGTVPTVLTSWRDDSAGGDSNGDGATNAPSSGNWRGIYLSPDSGGSVLSNCRIAYAGQENLGYFRGLWRRTSLFVDDCNPLIENCRFALSAGHGIDLFSSRATIRGNSFEGVGENYYAVVWSTFDEFPAMAGNKFSGTGIEGIALPGGSIQGTNLFANPGGNLAYYLNDDIAIEGSAVVQVEAGTTFRTANQRLLVYGTLIANGSPTAPVRFLSRRSTPGPGDWRGIYFGPTSGGSRLENVIIENAGLENLGYFQSAWRATSIFVESSSPTFLNLTIRSSFWHGLQLHAASPTIKGLQIEDCGGSAIIALEGSRPAIEQGSLNRNGSRGGGSFTVLTDAKSVPEPVAIRFLNNSYSGVAVDGGTLDASGTWKVWSTNAPYAITRDVSISTGATLTLEPGVVAKFNGSGLYVSGILLASGNDLPITLTSYRDDAFSGDTNNDSGTNAPAPGNWKGIYFSPNSGQSVLHNCTIKYSGLANLGYFQGNWRSPAVYVDSCSPRITSCRFLENGSHGIELFSSSATIRNNRFENQPEWGYPIVFDTLDSFPRLSGNEATGTGKGGIYLPAGTVSVSGAWPKPGNAFPYLPEGGISIGNEVVLTLEPGVVSKWVDGLYVNGRLDARGSESDRIRFTGRGDGRTPGEWKGIYFAPTASASTMRNCQILGAGLANLGYFNGGWRATSLYVDSSSPQFQNVQIGRSASAGIMICSGTPQIISSLIQSNAGPGISIFGSASPAIINNTIVQSGSSGIELFEGTFRAVNNIIALNGVDGLNLNRLSITSEGNLLFGNSRSNYFNALPGEGDLTADPRFVNAAAGDFHLLAGSPAIDTGRNVNIQQDWTDLDGKLRLAGGAVDRGAYESLSALASRVVDAQIQIPGDAGFTGIGARDPAIQSRGQAVLPQSAATYLLKMAYAGNLPDSVLVKTDRIPDGWKLKAYDEGQGSKDITTELTSPAGFTIPAVAPGSIKIFRLEITPGLEPQGNATLSLPVVFSPVGDPSTTDTVTAITTNLPTHQVDLAIRRQEDLGSTGAGIINATGAGQVRTSVADRSRPSHFVLSLRNKGNTAERLTLKGQASNTGWNLAYFDGSNPLLDRTAEITSAGLVTDVLPKDGSYEVRVSISINSNANSQNRQFTFTASPESAPSAMDVVRAEMIVIPDVLSAQKATYTSDADFALGVLAGVESESVSDQLQLSKSSITLPFLWVPNSNEGTVSKVDTRTGRELARYRTGPQNTGSPSRTTVDQQGNCWVANRVTGTAVKIALLEAGNVPDRNGNGRIDTSSDLNGDGDITGDEILPWGQDEAVIHEVVLIPGSEGTFAPGSYKGTYANDNWNPGPRGIAVDAKGNVWIGSYGTKKFVYVDGETGSILKTIDVSPVNHTSYGAVIDGQGVLWSAGQDKRHVMRLNPTDGSLSVLDLGHYVYGIGLDRSNHLFASGWTDARLSRINVLTGKKDWTVDGIQQSRGVAVTPDGDVWTANSSPGTVTRWSNDGVIKQSYPVGSVPTGVAIAADGKVWVVNDGEESIRRINPESQRIDLVKRIIGGTHYGYSDMTGIVARNATTRFGTWTVIHNAGIESAVLRSVSWHAAEPAGTRIAVKVRSSADLTSWSPWEIAGNGVALKSTPAARFLQAEISFQVLTGDLSPILQDFTFDATGGLAPVGPVELSVELESNGECVLKWPQTSQNWTLETSPDITEPTTWTPLNTAVAPQNGQYELRLPANESMRFFRLRKN